MRVVGGTLRGRQLAAPEHAGLRPTSDRVRENVFNILAHGIDGPSLDGSRVIDLFAGTGALGIEALSRGARYALFIDDGAESRALIRRNLEAFGLNGVSKIWRRDACDLGPAGNIQPFDIAFLDPPYGQGLGEKALASLAAGAWLAHGALLVVEERAGLDMALPAGFQLIEKRSWGDTEVRFVRRIKCPAADVRGSGEHAALPHQR
ncbi:MAG: 16S rRNA (guanine(966)-N(2))-methyltransferase RsmD [Hyphomicrobiaceae bacterium]